MQWLKLSAWKVRDRGLKPDKQNVSSTLTRKDSILWGASMTERLSARPKTVRSQILNPVYGGQCHLITTLRRFSWPSLPYNYVHKSSLKPHSFHFICQKNDRECDKDPFRI